VSSKLLRKGLAVVDTLCVMWDTAFLIAACVMLLVVNVAAVLLVAFQLPGTWVMLACTALLSWWRWSDVPADRLIGWYTLAALLGLALLGEALEALTGAAGSKIAGGTKRAAVLAVVGSIVGAIAGTPLIPIPIIGTLLGAAIGAAAGSLLGDRWAGREWKLSAKAAGGAAVGKLTGAVLKLAVAATMWVIVAGAMVI
jgi:uncharacterized protein YqgC (DUF456 family)